MEYKQIKAKINQRRSQILVHSCIYYRLNSSIVDDSTYDRWARELMYLQQDYPEIADECVYAEYFRDFSETTSGFDLPLELPSVVAKAQWLLEYHQHHQNK